MAQSPLLASVLGNDGAIRRTSALLKDHAFGTRSAEFVPVSSPGFLCSQAVDPSSLPAFSSDRLNQGRDHPDVSQTHEQAHGEGETGAPPTARRGTSNYRAPD